MYDTKLAGGSADREQLLRIQRELNEKYENEQPPASSAYTQEAAVAVADERPEETPAFAPRTALPAAPAAGKIHRRLSVGAAHKHKHRLT